MTNATSPAAAAAGYAYETQALMVKSRLVREFTRAVEDAVESFIQAAAWTPASRDAAIGAAARVNEYRLALLQAQCEALEGLARRTQGLAKSLVSDVARQLGEDNGNVAAALKQFGAAIAAADNRYSAAEGVGMDLVLHDMLVAPDTSTDSSS